MTVLPGLPTYLGAAGRGQMESYPICIHYTREVAAKPPEGVSGQN